jgi:hypothetical protein
MAPKDRLNLPFRWEFSPVKDPRDGSVHWRWRAYTQTGTLALESERTFESLTECMTDARRQGYAGR